MKKSKKSKYASFMEYTADHRDKNNLKIHDRRYIRGKINAVLRSTLHDRNTGDLTTDSDIRRRVLAKTGGHCYLCWRQYTTSEAKESSSPRLYFSKLQIDHVIALDKFGPNAISNYMPACARCNRIKSNLSLAEAKILIQKDIQKRGY